MSKHILRTKSLKKFPLRLILIVPFVIQTFAAVGLVGYLSFKNGEKAVNDLAEQLVKKSAAQVNEHLDMYLELPLQVTKMNAALIGSGSVNLENRRGEKFFWRQAKAFPKLAYVGYTLNNGVESGAGRWIQGIDIVLYENLVGQNQSSDYAADNKGDRAQLIQTYTTDALKEPWYKDVVAANKLIWTRIYTLSSANTQITATGQNLIQDGGKLNSGLIYYTAISAGMPVYDANGQLIGTTGADLLLTDINDFLRKLKISPSAQVFIFERNGLLVGNSSNYPVVYEQQGEGKRYSIRNSPNPLIQKVGKALIKEFGSIAAINKDKFFSINLDGQQQYIHLGNWRDSYGIDWLTVVVVPESDFMSQIHANNRTTILLIFVALIAALLFGSITAQKITQPIEKLNKVAAKIAGGELQQTIPANPIQELDAVGESFNQMAEQLEKSFVELETKVSDRTAKLQATLRELQLTQQQMVQSEKMSALGQMVAGVAHEINNPVSFIYGNLAHMENYTLDLLSIIAAYQSHYPEPPEALQTQIDDIDLEFITEDIEKLLKSTKVGAERIKAIVLSLRNFSRLDESEFKQADVHEGIDSTLLILQHRYHPAIVIERDYGELPPIDCYPGQLNQVFLNLLGNAIDALEAANIAQPKIRIWTKAIDNQIEIHIADNGIGIPEAIQLRIFDPFFTTKPVGKGTGLGLSISYQIITEKHHGKISCDSVPGEGTEFAIELPVYSL